MRQLILDHFRRWWWVLALGAAYATILGWCVALPPDYLQHARGTHIFWPVWLNVQGRMFVANTFCLATGVGALLLSFDLHRGLVRGVRALPVTRKQIGRAWWWATAGIPGIASVALLFLGAGTFYLLHSDKPFPFARLMLTGVFSVLWFGTVLTTYLNKATGSGFGPARHAALVNLVTGALLIWMIFGFALSLDAVNNPIKRAAFLLAGVLMTAIGWSRAGKFDPMPGAQSSVGRALQFISSGGGSLLTPLASADTRDLVRAPHDSGAIPFLMKSAFTRIFFMMLVLIVYAGVVFRLEGLIHSWDDAVRYIGRMAAVFWTIIFFQITPILRHLRCLRTLPISTNRLAVVLMWLGILPLLALGASVAGAAWLISGSAEAIAVLGGYTFTLAPAALCICFGVWRGGGLLSSAFLLIVLIGAFALSRREIPVPLSGLIVFLCVLSAFLLTRYALNRSRQPYLSRGATEIPWSAFAGDPRR